MTEQDKCTLYDPRYEHDACGIGAVVNIKGIKSHKTVSSALTIVERLEHRAGKDSSGETGDGVGIMLDISHDFFINNVNIELGNAREYGVGMFFFGDDYVNSMKTFESIVIAEEMEFMSWREVPVNTAILGKKALDSMPRIMQCFIKKPADVSIGLRFDRRLYIVRRLFEKACQNDYVVSLSSRTIVYKGMFLVNQLRAFYPDLQDERYESAIALVHSRFSTNTNPSWERSHPNRIILHNGEINTIRGNADRMLSREETMKSSVSGDNINKVLPVIDAHGSDSAILDNTIEFFMMNGIPLPLAMMITVPEPWRSDSNMSQAKKDFYHYWSTMMEPWDGPAAIIFSDGDIVGATLDRNGLRPSRYYITDDDTLILSSETGVLDIPAEKIIKKSRLRSGEILLIDTVEGKILSDAEIKSIYSSKNPYGEWLDMEAAQLKSLPIPNKRPPHHDKDTLSTLYKVFGYTYEDVKDTIIPMAANAAESIVSMGIDTPLAVLSSKHQLLFNYFKQMFAQVTNPPIDAIREEIVTDTTIYIGSYGNILEENSSNCRVLEIKNPILTAVDLLKIKAVNKPGFNVTTISLLYDVKLNLQEAMDNLLVACDKARNENYNIIIISDRGADENHLIIPSLIAVSALHRRHVGISIILESGEPREAHHFAVLLGYGAGAINPYLAHECIADQIDKGILDKDYHTAIDDYNSAVLHAVVKIASKMGISTLQSYHSSQIFEILGLNNEVVEKYFPNTVSRIGGIGLKEIDNDIRFRHTEAYNSNTPALDSIGSHKLRSGDSKEDHMYNPRTIIALREATQRGDYSRYKEYSKMIDDENTPHTLRGLLEFKYEECVAIPIDEVESVESIVKRFKTGAMSYGSISEEAHECMAIAMNRLGGKSNSGEGGEKPERLNTERGSAIKQVASGRFGVTSEYLLSAKEIQIKMAQGAKPGEGGHLPGRKVYPWIAKTRHSTPGVSLISPPPHHDIYSIEDLAQLIYDLKNANSDASISVKLVSEAGVGTIAAGVAKSGAEVILISGYDGGTGAAPQTSIQHAGLPWELGLAETHHTLIHNGLRSQVRLETDGKLMTGRDVAVAAMLGAEEFGFATAPLVTMGCVMMRVCNLDTCPVGVATQNSELRKRFKGKPEYVMNFMKFIAAELREIMSELGINTIEQLIGRNDLIRVKSNANTVDLSALLGNCDNTIHFEKKQEFDLSDKLTLSNIDVTKKYTVSNTDRTFGTLLGSQITKRYGTSLSDDTYIIKCQGTGGQSFGAFIPKGLTMYLEGDSNDYFGKGLSGGKLIIRPTNDSILDPAENIIVGNVAFYGATSGETYINGIAGERFCVRNSGITAVVEGTGDHGCEYMTGGTVVIIGDVGRNFAAGMSGGVAYVLDENHELYTKLNKSMVKATHVTDDTDIEKIKELLTNHMYYTNSEKADLILKNFTEYIPLFKKIIPIEYEKMMIMISDLIDSGLSREEAENQAFINLKG